MNNLPDEPFKLADKEWPKTKGGLSACAGLLHGKATYDQGITNRDRDARAVMRAYVDAVIDIYDTSNTLTGRLRLERLSGRGRRAQDWHVRDSVDSAAGNFLNKPQCEDPASS